MHDCSPLLASGLALAVLAACRDASSGGSPSAAPDVQDLGFVAQRIVVAEGVLAATIDERGVDLNGDGDDLDLLLRVVDLATGRETTVPNVAPFAGPTAGGGFVAFLAPELAEGRDLNGDGDTADNVLGLVDASTGTVTSTGLACRQALAQDGALIAFAVPEDEQRADLDGNGVRRGEIAFVHDVRLGRTTPLGIAVFSQLTRVSEHRVLLVADERDAGDRNGDGDRVDEVAFLYDVDTDELHDTARAIRDARLAGPLCALLVHEEENGNRDLNSNGRTSDHFGEFYDLDLSLEPLRTTRGRFCTLSAADRDLALHTLANPGSPDPLIAFDRQTLSFVEFPQLPVSPDSSGLRDRRCAALAWEGQLGNDVNGDGDRFDLVPVILDARTGVMTPSTSVALSDPEMSAHAMVFLGEGPGSVPTLFLQDVDAGVVFDPGLPCDGFALEDEFVLASVPESDAGEDLNGDGDPFDDVLLVHDLRTHRTRNTRIELFHRFHDAGLQIELSGDLLYLRQQNLRLTAVRIK